MTYIAEASDGYLPSHRRPMYPGEQWLIDWVANRFLLTGAWPKLDLLRRDAFRERVDLPEIPMGIVIGDFRWRPGSDGEVSLSITGLARCQRTYPLAEQLVAVALLCRDIYLGEGEDEPKVTSEDLRSTLGFDDATIARVHALMPSEYFLTRGGAANSPVAWYYIVNETVAEFRDVRTVEEYFDVRGKLLRPVPVGRAVMPALLAPRQPRIDNPEVVKSAASVAESVALAAPAGPDPRAVFVVHGRCLSSKAAVWRFLQCAGLLPLDWDQMVAETKEGTPYTGHVIERGFSMAKAFVVLMTPDDEARLHADLCADDDPDDERELTCQPRPNVLLEAGMAIGAHPESTIIVHVGHLRRVTDLSGRNVVVLGPTKAPWNALAKRLETIGCPVDWEGVANFDPSDFTNVPSLTRRAERSSTGRSAEVGKGRVLPPSARTPQPRLSVKLLDRGTRDHLLEIANHGTVALRDISWEIADEAPNWHVIGNALPEYPVAELGPREYVRVPVAIAMGGPAYVTLHVRATTENGEVFQTTAKLSVYG